jgi:hypothetical protein
MALTRVLTLLGLWAVGGTLLWWGEMPPRLRRLLALVFSAAGLAFLAVAFNTAGLREADTTAGYLMGPVIITGKASASASLPYYVMTGLCLLLGTVGLTLPEAAARALRRHWLVSAIGLSIAVTLVRLMLERAAAPPGLAWAFGITGLAPLVGAFFAYSGRAEGRSLRQLIGALAVYALAVRGWVALVYSAATLARIGSTHYDVSRVMRARNPLTGEVHLFSPGSLEQVVTLVWVPQFAMWPLYTIAAGLVGAGVARLFTARPRPEVKRVAAAPEMAAIRQD